MAHDARAIANTLIKLGAEKNRPLTPMQIIKLVYICHGFMLGLYHRPLIIQPIEAWKYGPVIETLYASMRKYRSSHVTKEIRIGISFKSKLQLDEYEQDIVEQVFAKYSHLSGIELSTLTHQPGTPWHIACYQRGQRRGIIPNDIIESYYSAYC